MKYVLVLLLLLSSASFVSAECVIGVDDLCDPECLPPGVACDQDPHGHPDEESDHAECSFERDGYCSPECIDSDIDCIIEFREAYVLEQENLKQEQIEKEVTQSFSARFDNSTPSSFEITLIGVGFFLFALGAFWTLRHLKEKKQRSQYTSLIPYGQSALEQGYSHSQIKSSLKSQGYSPKFIKGYMKALEHRP